MLVSVVDVSPDAVTAEGTGEFTGVICESFAASGIEWVAANWAFMLLRAAASIDPTPLSFSAVVGSVEITSVDVLDEASDSLVVAPLVVLLLALEDELSDELSDAALFDELPDVVEVLTELLTLEFSGMTTISNYAE